jgi:hypothetical protein
MFTINTSSNFINLTDLNNGYKGFSLNLKQIEFNWKKASEYGYELIALAALGGDDLQVCTRTFLKPDQLLFNGEESIAFDAYADIYETLVQVRQSLYDQSGIHMKIIGMSVTGSVKQELIVIFSRP